MVLHIFSFEKEHKFRKQTEDYIFSEKNLKEKSIFISFNKENFFSITLTILKAIVFNYRIVFHGIDKKTLAVFFLLSFNKKWLQPWGGEIRWLTGRSIKGKLKKFLILKVFYSSQIVSTDSGEFLFRDYPIKIDKVNLVSGGILSNYIQHSYDRVPNKGYIMVGHSAHKCNRHLEILNSFDFVKQSLLVPLAYSKSETYIQEIISLLRRNEYSYRILNETISKREYYEVLNSFVNTAIIASANCGMAYSNVIHLLYMGKTVVLPEENKIYRHLCKLGCHILPISKFNLGDSITELEMEVNRAVILKHFSIERIRCNYENWYNI